MRLSHRPRHTDRPPWGIWIFPALVLVAAGAWLVSEGYVRLGTCGLKELVGLPCLSCGATRATLLLLDGQFGPAFAMQPLVIVAYGLLIMWGLISLGTLATGRKLAVSLTRRESVLLKVAVVVLPVANWCYLVAAGI